LFNDDINRKERNRLYMQPVPGIQIVGTTQRDVGRKNRVGRGKKGDRMKKTPLSISL